MKNKSHIISSTNYLLYIFQKKQLKQNIHAETNKNKKHRLLWAAPLSEVLSLHGTRMGPG